MIQVGLDKQWLKILDDYIAPIQEKVFIGFYKRVCEFRFFFNYFLASSSRYDVCC